MDKAKRQNIDLINKAENVCYEADKQMELFKDSISEEEKTKIETLATEIRETIKNKDFTRLETQVDGLKNLMTTMLQNQQNVATDLNDI